MPRATPCWKLIWPSASPSRSCNGRHRDDPALAGVRAGPEGPGVHGAGPQVVLEQAAEVDALVIDAEMRGVPVTVLPSDDALVDPRELLGPVVEALLDDLPGVEVD